MTTLQAHNLSVHLGGKSIIRNMSFDIRSGEFIGILGPNGAGKSTLFNALLHLIKPNEGSIVYINGQEGHETVIGYVPQMRQIDPDLPMQAWDFVSLGLPHSFRPWLTRQDKSAVQTALELTGSAHYANKSVGLLSGGERQRVFLAQALVRNPDILLLDEPTSNLDPGAQEAMTAVVNGICRERGIIVLFISHDVNLIARYADRILYLTPGHYAIGTVQEVMQPDVLKQLYGGAVELVHVAGKLLVIATDSTGSAAICYHEDAAV